MNYFRGLVGLMRILIKGKTMKQLIIATLLVTSLSSCDDLLYDQVAEDFEKQYQIAKKQGDPIQICVQAGLVSAGYLQAKNEEKYNYWKSVEKIDCSKAGIQY